MALQYAQVPDGALKKPSPFKAAFPQDQIEELNTLLKLSKIPSPTYESLQEDRRFGVSHSWVTNAKKYWLDEYSWRKCEDHINSFPNFTADVAVNNDNHKIHFTALFSQKPEAIPIALFHGWPGSFLEFLPILSLMKAKYTPQELPYHLIVPSLPGFAFSSKAPLDHDFSAVDIATVMNQLMIDLGFGAGYIAQGGDIGSRVAKTLAAVHDECKAIHLNFFIPSTPPDKLPRDNLSARDLEGVLRGEEWVKMGTAYALEQATRPSTLGMVLGSSPLAVLSWIGEKFLEWSDVDVPLEEILNDVTLYWLTECFHSNIYTYRGRYLPQPQPGMEYIEKPTGFSNFPRELLPMPKAFVEKEVNLVFHRDHDKGGHFAALEQPELLMTDLEDFVKQVWTK